MARDLPGAPALGQMVRRLLALVPELPRLRLSSLDPVEIDDELWRLIGEEPRLMPHLHLSLQAGDDLILKRMKRRHGGPSDRARARACARAAAGHRVRRRPHRRVPDRDRGDVREHARPRRGSCGLAFLHVFPYSARARHAGRAHAAGAGDAAARARGAAARSRRAAAQAALPRPPASARRRRVLVERAGRAAKRALRAGARSTDAGRRHRRRAMPRRATSAPRRRPLCVAEARMSELRRRLVRPAASAGLRARSAQAQRRASPASSSSAAARRGHARASSRSC